jgi:hypothetical protein
VINVIKTSLYHEETRKTKGTRIRTEEVEDTPVVKK